MAYNHGREDRKWRIWKEAEEKLLRECGVDEATIEQIRIADRADFNSNRRFYRWTNDVAEYLEDMAGRERQAEVGTVAELLEEIESENLYQVLVTVDGRTLKIVLLKMQGYSTKEIAPLVHLTTGAIYARLGSGISPLIFGRRKTGWHIKLRRTRFGRNPRKAAQGILSALRTGRANPTSWKCRNSSLWSFGRWNAGTGISSNGTSGTGSFRKYGTKR